MTSAKIAGVGKATVYAKDRDPQDGGGTTYWLVVATKTQSFAAEAFHAAPPACGRGDCTKVIWVEPVLRAFSNRVGNGRAIDLGLVLGVEGFTDHDTIPRSTTYWKRKMLIACGTTGTNAWSCRSAEATRNVK